MHGLKQRLKDDSYGLIIGLHGDGTIEYSPLCLQNPVKIYGDGRAVFLAAAICCGA